MAIARELTVDVPVRRRRAALAAVSDLGVMGVQLRDRASGAPPGRVQVVAWLPPLPATEAAAAALAAALGPTARVFWRDVPVTWEAAPAHPVGRGFLVVPLDEAGAAPDATPAGAEGAAPDPTRAAPPANAALCDAARAASAASRAASPDTPTDRRRLVVDGALAFGDGLHPTTALCVEALEDRFAGRAPPTSVLDVGTGTGILALVASHLGAPVVIANDIDPLARWAAARTFAANRAPITLVDALPETRFDLVVANLYLAPLLALLPALAARRAPAGTLLLSGFVEGALPEVRTTAEAAGLALTEVRARDGWVAAVAARRT